MKKTLSQLILSSLLISYLSSTAPVVNLFNHKEQIIHDNYLNITENFKNHKNGAKISVFGWLKIESLDPDNHPFLKLSSSKVRDGMSGFLANQLALIGYSDLPAKGSADPSSKLFLQFPDTAQSLKKVVIPFSIPKNTWFFLTYAFDYMENVTQLYVNYQKDGRDFFVKRKFEVDFLDFQLDQFLIINVGCFPIAAEYSKVSQRCLQGRSQQFSYVLDFFENPELLFLLDSDFEIPKTFTFDFYQKHRGLADSQGKTKSQLAIVQRNDTGDSQTSTSLQVEGELKFINKEFIERGTVQFRLGNLSLLDEKKPFSAPSFYFAFNFLEPLAKRYRILQILSKEGLPTLEAYIVKERNQTLRFLDFVVNGTQFGFRTKYIFQAGLSQKFTLSLIQEDQLFWVIFDHPLQRIFSLKKKLRLLGKSEAVFFEKDNSFKGGIKILQLSQMNNSSGNVQNYFAEIKIKTELRDKILGEGLKTSQTFLAAKTSQILQNNVCTLYGNFNYKYEKCLSCGKNYVFQPDLNKCASYCPFGSKNQGGICLMCEQKSCPELPKRYFSFKKSGASEFTISHENLLIHEKQNFYDLFQVDVENKQFFKDYFFNVFKEGEKEWRVHFEFKDRRQNYKVIFTLKESSKLNSNDLNEVPLVSAHFNTLSKNQEPVKELFKSKHFDQIFSIPKEKEQQLITEAQGSHTLEKIPYFPLLPIMSVENKLLDEIQKPMKVEEIILEEPKERLVQQQENQMELTPEEEIRRQKLIQIILKKLRAQKVKFNKFQEQTAQNHFHTTKNMQERKDQPKQTEDRTNTQEWLRNNGYIFGNQSEESQSVQNPEDIVQTKQQLLPENGIQQSSQEWLLANGYNVDQQQKNQMQNTTQEYITQKSNLNLEEQENQLDWLKDNGYVFGQDIQQKNEQSEDLPQMSLGSNLLKNQKNKSYDSQIKQFYINKKYKKKDFLNDSDYYRFDNKDQNLQLKERIKQNRKEKANRNFKYGDSEESDLNIPKIASQEKIQNQSSINYEDFIEVPLNIQEYKTSYQPQQEHMDTESNEFKDYQASLKSFTVANEAVQNDNKKNTSLLQRLINKHQAEQDQLQKTKLKQDKSKGQVRKQLTQVKQKNNVKYNQMKKKLKNKISSGNLEQKQNELSDINQEKVQQTVRVVTRDSLNADKRNDETQTTLQSQQAIQTQNIKVSSKPIHRTFIQKYSVSPNRVQNEQTENINVNEIPDEIQQTEKYLNSNKSYILNNTIKKENGRSFQKTFAQIIYFMVVLGLASGFLLLILKVVKNNQNFIFFDKLVQIILFTQFFAFWTFYLQDQSPKLKEFLIEFYRLFIGNNQIWQKSDDKPGLNNIDKNFLTNFGLILVVQVTILALYLVLKWIQKMYKNQAHSSMLKHKKNQRANFLSKWFSEIIGAFEWKILFSVLMVFSVQSWIFGLYNIKHLRSVTGYTMSSFVVAVFYVVVIAAVLIIAQLFGTFSNKQKYNQNEDIINSEISELDCFEIQKKASSLSFLYCGLNTKHFYQRNFKFLQYYYFLSFGAVLVFLQKYPISMIIVNFSLFTVITGLVVFGNLVKYDSWNYEQIFVFGTTLLAKLIVLIEVVYGGQFEVLDHLSVFLIGLVLLESSLLMIMQFVQEMFRQDTINDDICNKKGASNENCEEIEIRKSDGQCQAKLLRLQEEIEELVENQKSDSFPRNMKN